MRGPQIVPGVVINLHLPDGRKIERMKITEIGNGRVVFTGMALGQRRGRPGHWWMPYEQVRQFGTLHDTQSS